MRFFSQSLLATIAALLLFAAPAAADDLPTRIDPPLADPSQAMLAEAGPAGDIALGSDKARVTVIEYASLGCSHCAHFANVTFPELKKRYIDTGKARYILREFPLDPLSMAAFMLARCAGKDKFLGVAETLFAKQSEWLVKEPMPPLKKLVAPFGVNEAAFNQCLANKKIREDIYAVLERADKFGVHATPTFFVNGKRLVGDQSIESLGQAIDAAAGP